MWSPLISGGEPRWSGRVSCSCSTSHTRRVTLVSNRWQVMNWERTSSIIIFKADSWEYISVYIYFGRLNFFSHHKIHTDWFLLIDHFLRTWARTVYWVFFKCKDSCLHLLDTANLNVATSNNISDRLIKTYGGCHTDIAYELRLY